MKNRLTQIILNNRSLHDLTPAVAGYGKIIPAHRCRRQPQEKLLTLLHYVVSGKCIFYMKNQVYPLHEGQVFLLKPGEYVEFISDGPEPFSLRWVGFTGSLAGAFASFPPVFDAPQELFACVEGVTDYDDYMEYRLASELMLLYSELMPRQKKEKRNYIQMAIDYVEDHYMNSISLQEIADHVGVNPYYLSRKFKAATGVSLQAHILDVRLRQAKHYLMLNHPIKEVVSLCGFCDTSYFFKVFKRENGLTPKEWRASKDASPDL